MSTLQKRVKVSKKSKRRELISKETLRNFSQEELIEKILALEAHNVQLQNILQKQTSSDSETRTKAPRKIDFSKMSKRHVFLKFYYFGWDYQGYVVQEDTINTIENFLFKALEKCCLIENRESSNYHRCGRTDKGVSAFSQVISIDLRSKLLNPSQENVNEEFSYCSMLNRLLPDNIRCYAWSHVGPNISSRFDCSWRTYKYYFPKGNLKIQRMQEGAKYLLGNHDFRNLCKMDVGNGIVDFHREIKFVDIRQCSKEELSSENNLSSYQMYEFIIQGNGFLWHQIRCIMSILLLIGQEKEAPEIIKYLLNVAECPRKPQYSMASHLPLNLFDVGYNENSLKWNTDEKLYNTLELLQSQWTAYQIKSTMIKDVIGNLEKLMNGSAGIEKQTDSLIEGVKSKTYTPLLSRMKCESLENKINHYLKRRKLEIENDDVTPA